LGCRPYRTIESFEQLGTDGALATIGERRTIPAGWTLVHTPDGKSKYYRYYKLNDPKGGDPKEWSVELRVREFPGIKP
jgi:hypothetical protein